MASSSGWSTRGPVSSSSSHVWFTNPQYFTRLSTGDGWTCDVCISKHNKKLEFPSNRAAIQHESTSAEHAEHVSGTVFDWGVRDESGWAIDVPPLTDDGLRVQERQMHVDHVYDIVPFWRKGVEAAERGEVLKMEVFLERLEARGPWGTFEDAWNAGTTRAWGDQEEDMNGNWGKVEFWAVGDADSINSARTNSGCGYKSDSWRSGQKKQSKAEMKTKETVGGNKGTNGSRYDETYLFVEDVARQEAVDEGRKKRMHIFSKMPTHQKIQKIQEMICFLRAIPG